MSHTQILLFFRLPSKVRTISFDDEYKNNFGGAIKFFKKYRRTFRRRPDLPPILLKKLFIIFFISRVNYKKYSYSMYIYYLLAVIDGILTIILSIADKSLNMKIGF